MVMVLLLLHADEQLLARPAPVTILCVPQWIMELLVLWWAVIVCDNLYLN